MVICKLMGGLGNQMFQYAMARSISAVNPIYLDLNFLKSNTTSTATYTVRNAELGIFQNLNVKPLNSFLAELITSQSKKYYLFKLFLPKSLKNINIITDENASNFLKTTIDHYLDGYFQNPSYFNSIREQLIEEFKFPALPKQLEGIKQTIIAEVNSVSIHVRRGDYLRPEIAAYHGVLGTDYYKKALNEVDTTNGEPHYFIFSDDPEWCASNLDFISNKTIISNKNQPWMDMYLMSLSKQHIIANSSFSWWGAWLSKNAQKKVIAPLKWFNHSSSNILPKEWTVV